MTTDEIEREILKELFDNGDIVDDNFERFYSRRKGFISFKISQTIPKRKECKEYATRLFASSFPYERKLEIDAFIAGTEMMRIKIKK